MKGLTLEFRLLVMVLIWSVDAAAAIPKPAPAQSAG